MQSNTTLCRADRSNVGTRSTRFCFDHRYQKIQYDPGSASRRSSENTDHSATFEPGAEQILFHLRTAWEGPCDHSFARHARKGNGAQCCKKEAYSFAATPTATEAR